MISSSARRRLAVGSALSLVLGVSGALAIALPASADTYSVDSTADDGSGNTLREAVALANGNPGHDTIEFDASLANSTVFLDDQITITDGVTITGLGAGQLSVARNMGSFSMFRFLPNIDGDRDLTVTGLRFQGDSGGGFGPAIESADARDITIDDVTVVNGEYFAGGALSILDTMGSIEISNSLFTGNVSTVNGGAISIDRADSVSLVDTDFSLNSANASGGAVHLDNIATSVTVDGGVWTENVGGGTGGALSLMRSFFLTAPTVTITDGEYEDNWSYGSSGGAIFLTRAGAVTLTGGTFLENTADGNGGAVSISSTSATISSATFSGNDATSLRGGGLFVQTIDGITQVVDCVFEENSAPVDSGALHIFNSASFSVSGSEFLRNSAPIGGAFGASTVLETGTIADSLFDGNTATGAANSQGGAISFQSDVSYDMTVARSTFTGNTALTGPNARGGAIHAFWVTGTLTVVDSTFSGNDVGPNGGGVSVAVSGNGLDGLLDITNSTFAEPNSTDALDAAMVYVDSVNQAATVALEHSTFTGDFVFRSPFVSGSAVLSHVLVDSDAAATPVRVDGVSSADVEWSLFTTAEPATVVSANTRYGVADLKLGPLQNNGGPTETRLPLAGSPAIDKGNPAATGLPAYDQRGAGFDRVLHAIVDIGAIEVPFVLPPTGQAINPVVPLAGGLLLLVGVAGGLIERSRRRVSPDA